MDISERLKAARAAMGKTQEQVAFEAGMNVTQYNAYERARSRPSPATLERIAAALQTTSEALTVPAAVSSSATRASSVPRADVIQNLRDRFREDIAAELGVASDLLGVRIELLGLQEIR
ncbi:helix-turn-helix transcriptional regulator [Chelatococcus sambhunathii]|uniref:Helix-turn-helix transcriptional regulator n=1 Tax=Chelatococcus sambhunathii TaxID=363953 RepID=A0ABU1DEH4_9HYPH|nr:helix-turn-helix transcriptional regulator [Chelatococcus sambhunathii]MDR4306460.1 helix-turn-helix transcriptional regulator [Chelatococcus sambhunathii]